MLMKLVITDKHGEDAGDQAGAPGALDASSAQATMQSSGETGAPLQQQTKVSDTQQNQFGNSILSVSTSF